MGTKTNRGLNVKAVIALVSILLASVALGLSLVQIIDQAGRPAPAPAQTAAPADPHQPYIHKAQEIVRMVVNAPDAIFSDVLVIEINPQGVAMVSGLVDWIDARGITQSRRFYIDLKRKGSGFVTVGRPDFQIVTR